MPQNKNSQEPPKTMTWGQSSIVLVPAALFDLARAFFALFWFFGPALAAAYCSSKVSGWVGSLWGLTENVCVAGAAVAGVYVSAITIPFGVVMADAVGLAAFLVLGLLVVWTNARIFKSGPAVMLRLTGGLGISVIPIIGAIPAYSLVLWRLYAKQIEIEGAARKQWEKERAEDLVRQARERQQQAVQIMQMRDMQNSQALQQQGAANDAVYGEQEKKKGVEAANDEQYTPDMRKAA